MYVAINYAEDAHAHLVISGHILLPSFLDCIHKHSQEDAFLAMPTNAIGTITEECENDKVDYKKEGRNGVGETDQRAWEADTK